MIYRVNFDLKIFRLLFNNLYTRLLEFGLQRDWTEKDIVDRLIAVLVKDQNTHLLVTISNTEITSHCLYVVQGSNIIMEQIKVDDKKDNETCKQYIAYAEELAKQDSNLRYILGITTRTELKALQKAYGFEYYNTLIRKELKHDESISHESVIHEGTYSTT